MSQMKVYIVGIDLLVRELFERVFNAKIVYDIREAQLAVFTGGADVDPSLYGHKRHPKTFVDISRDESEMIKYSYFLEQGIPMVGICRGGQFLNVMNQGTMYQHVTKHTEPHNIVDERSGEAIYVTSTHHQMMRPGPGAQLIAFSTQKGEREWMDGEVIQMEQSDKDYEVLFYEETNCLCFQPHPEYRSSQMTDMVNYFKRLVEEFFV